MNGNGTAAVNIRTNKPAACMVGKHIKDMVLRPLQTALFCNTQSTGNIYKSRIHRHLYGIAVP